MHKNKNNAMSEQKAISPSILALTGAKKRGLQDSLRTQLARNYPFPAYSSRHEYVELWDYLT